MIGELSSWIAVTALVIFAYLVTISSVYLAFTIVAYLRLRQDRRRWTARELDAVMRSPATPAVSIIVPAHNEAATVVESIRSIFLLHYPQFEVIVVNDGSTDGTLRAAIDAFGLLRAPVSYPQTLPTAVVKAVHRSLSNRDLVVIDKENGGKADAVNAGINAARYPLVCVIDADSLLEEQALARVALPFIEDPDTIASGGIIRVVNGCTVERGRVVDVGLPRSRLATFQVVEYLRAFLGARVALSAFNSLLIISGAFGVFRRDAVIAVGGFQRESVGEDTEMVTRLHRLYRERGQRCRIVFLPHTVCWTEVPETFRVLSQQRNRWQRGTLDALATHKRMFLNSRYGVVGLFAMPYYLLFEALGSAVELMGIVITALAVSFGLLDWRFAELLFLATVLYGALLSVSAVLLEELSFRRYPRLTDLLRLVAYGILENFGYRQLTSWWRITGIVSYLRGEQGWGVMTRKGFSPR